MRYNKLLLGIFFMLTNCLETFCQDKPVVNLSFVSQENIEYSALKSVFYLIRQEYVINAKNGDKITRGGNDYFGKAYTIGILTEDQRLWFPKFIRSPWNEDVNFTDYKEQYKPGCTFTKIRSLNDSIYRNFNLFDSDNSEPIMSFGFGYFGIKISDTIADRGCLIIFHTSDQIPEKKESIKYSIANIDNAEWNSEGIFLMKEPYLGNNQQIIGGAFFRRIITLAKIEWELAGLYVKINNDWVIKSMILSE